MKKFLLYVTDKLTKKSKFIELTGTNKKKLISEIRNSGFSMNRDDIILIDF